MLADTLKDVDQVRVGIDPMEPTRHDQALRDADLLRAEFGPTEIPIFLPIGITQSFCPYRARS
jgi:hypothetical protein